VEVFGDVYLRLPNEDDTARLLAMGESRGFHILGSIVCMHQRWKNYPSAWQCMYTGHVHEPTIILEAVADGDLWIWHAFLWDAWFTQRHQRFAPVFFMLAEGQAPEVNYTINNNEYAMGYYLADGIYLSWTTFAKTIPEPQGNKKKYFATAQEACRKDVERAFGVLQARLAIVRGLARFWDEDTLGQIMRASVIMHNMIVEDERDEEDDLSYDGVGEKVKTSHDETPKL
jgi:hypothetical protein